MPELKECPSERPWDNDEFTFDYIAQNIFSPIYPVIAEVILKTCGRREGRMIDLGCGGGHLGFAVMERTGYQGVFVDINETALRIAGKRAGERGLSQRSEFLNRDVERTGLPDHYGDLIISRGSYTFWNDLEKAILEIYRILAPGGHDLHWRRNGERRAGRGHTPQDAGDLAGLAQTYHGTEQSDIQ
ncbi:class I SAM-dependent methyltransferase [Enterocloster citroniae]|uniref:class I SAM-dependent methyltransferase n=1 Tax=Enterocloster citroniae TaxID=358743 RepID=UPI00189847D1|nr:class I SAM-dependent methyltransferase [Enterocloster citroniae]